MKPKPIIKTNFKFKKWLRSRPESIKRLAKEFPFGIVWRIGDKNLVIIGWNESDTVIFSRLYLNDDLTPDIDKIFSQNERLYICAEHFREANVTKN